MSWRTRALGLAVLGATAGCAGRGPAPTATPGAAYVTTGETAFYDSGCAQERATDGKLKTGTRFTLVGAAEGCWNVKLDGEDEVYIVPDRVAAAN